MLHAARTSVHYWALARLATATVCAGNALFRPAGLASPAPYCMDAATTRLGRGSDDMNAASTPYQEGSEPVSAVTAVAKRLCGTTGTVAR